MPKAPSRKVILYLDYHGVLNTGIKDMLGEMCQFLVQVDLIRADVRVNLLSKCRGDRGNNTTMDELRDAGVLDLFDQITFTSVDTGHDHQGDTAIEHHIYSPSSHDNEAVTYTVFYGGKDQYICSQHGQHRDARLIFVDDDWVHQTSQAVKSLTPHICCILMLPPSFYSIPNIYGHVHNLRELYTAIRQIVYCKSSSAHWV